MTAKDELNPAMTKQTPKLKICAPRECPQQLKSEKSAMFAMHHPLDGLLFAQPLPRREVETVCELRRIEQKTIH